MNTFNIEFPSICMRALLDGYRSTRTRFFNVKLSSYISQAVPVFIICLFISVSCLTLSPSIFLSFCFHLSLFLSLSLSISLYHSLPLSLFLSISFPSPFIFFLCVSLSLSFFLSFFLSFSALFSASSYFFRSFPNPFILFCFCSTCGMEYQERHFSGNFYWASCDHIASLPQLNNRFDAWFVP